MNLFDVAESTATKDQKEPEESSSVETPEGVPPVEDLPDYEGVTEGFSPTDEQRCVLGHVEHGSGNGIVEAVAGSGKTDVLIACARLVANTGTKCLICALNKSVAQELDRRVKLDDITVSTVHSAGLGALKRAQDDVTEPESWKMEEILEPMISGTDLEEKRSELAKICRLIKSTCTDPEADGEVRQMAQKYGMEWNERYSDVLPRAIQKSLDQTWEEGRIDHEDMLYVPLVSELFTDAYEWVFVDEAQDLNGAQQKATTRLKKPEGRSLYVGDRNQAIYGFQGAHPDSMDHITDRLGATEMKMTISFRCPRRHVAKAQALVPEIQPTDQADEGTVETHDVASIPEVVRPGDLVIGRFNTLLEKWCLRTVELGTPAYLKGEGRRRDIGSKVQKTLRNAVKDVEGKRDPGQLEMAQLRNDLRSYRGRAAEVARGQGVKKEQIRRRADAALAISKRMGASSSPAETAGETLLDRLEAKIEVAFADPTQEEEENEAPPENDAEEVVEFSTIHKAKGREASRVGIIEPDWDRNDESDPTWLSEQEENLQYVMLTRSTDTLLLFKEGGGAVEETEGDAEASSEYMRLQEGAVRQGKRLVHKEYGTGTVVTASRADDGKMIMRFPADTGHREVSLRQKVFKPADPEESL